MTEEAINQHKRLAMGKPIPQGSGKKSSGGGKTPPSKK